MLRNGLVVFVLSALLIACGVVSPAVASDVQVRQVTVIPMPTATTLSDVPLLTRVARAEGDGAWNSIYDKRYTFKGGSVEDPDVTLVADVYGFKIPDNSPEYDWYLINVSTQTEVKEGHYQCNWPYGPFDCGYIGWYFQNSNTRIDASVYADSPVKLEDYGPPSSPAGVTDSFTIGGSLSTSPSIDASFSRSITHPSVSITDHSSLADKYGAWSEDFLCPHGKYELGCVLWDKPSAESAYSHKMEYAAIVKVVGGVPNRGAHVSLSLHDFAYLDYIESCFYVNTWTRYRYDLGRDGIDVNLYKNNQPQVDSFYPNNTPVAAEVGQRLDFSVDWSDPDGTVDTVTWYLDDVEQGSGESWTWTIPSGAGGATGQTHVVTAVVADELDSTTQLWNVQVGPEATWADFSASPTLGQAPLEVAFTDLSDNSPSSWAWDFGDGGTSAQQHPTHTYANAGMYTVRLTAVGGAGSSTKTKQQYVLATFADVPCEPAEHWAMRAILACVEAGIVQGYSEGTYCPDVPVTRDQMAVYIARAEGWINIGDAMDTAPELFPDVPAGFWAGTAIQSCVDNNIVQGYEFPDLETPGESFYLYEPAGSVTRDQMAVFIARSICDPTGDEGLVGYVPADPRNFPDVPNTGYGDSGTDPYWAYRYIEYCVEHGVVSGYGDGTYHPEGIVTRDQMAMYVARAFSLPM